MFIQPLSVGRNIGEKSLRSAAPANAKKGPALLRRALDELNLDALLLILERIADGDAIPVYARAAEFKVVANEIKVRFRTYEDGACHIETHTAAHVSHKVIAALKIRAAGKTTGEKGRIKPQALDSNPALQLCLRLLAKRWRNHTVEIVQDGTVRIEKDVHVLVSTPGHFPAKPKIFLPKQEIAAEGGVGAPANALWCVCRRIGCVGSRLAKYCTYAERKIKLLSISRAGAEEKQTKGRSQ